MGGIVAGALHDEPSTTSDHSLDIGGALIKLVIVTSVVVAFSGLIGMGVHKPSRSPGGAQVPQAR